MKQLTGLLLEAYYMRYWLTRNILTNQLKKQGTDLIGG